MSAFGYDVIFYGGYDDALRTMMCAYEGDTSVISFPIEPVYFKFRESDQLSHRDFLGALMAIGIERSCVGDIVVNNGCAVCYLKSDIAEFVKSQIFKVGRIGVKITDKKPKNLVIANSFDEKVITVSSMRLDVLVASLTGLSREKTAELIMSGKAFYNYSQTQNVSLKISDGILSIRGYGKFIIENQIGFTKKGRIKLLIKHFR
jgi:RNA-binding protein YlmH